LELERAVKKILLVEDERIAQIVNKMLLEELGYRLDIAENGQQAFDMAQSNDYCLIFMDIGLPDINGIEVTLKIRGCEKARRIPIVALTAFMQADLEEKCLAAGMDQVLTKPTAAAALQQAITHLAA